MTQVRIAVANENLISTVIVDELAKSPKTAQLIEKAKKSLVFCAYQMVK